MNTIAWGAAGLWLLFLARLLNPKANNDRFHPVRIIGWGWAVMFVFSASQLIEFPTVSFKPWLFLVGFVSLLMIGAFIGARRATASFPQESNTAFEDFMLTPEVMTLGKIIIIIGVIGLVANLYVIFIDRPVDFSDIDKIRNADLRDIVGTTTWADRVVYLTLPFTWMSLVITCLFSERLEGRFRILAIASIIGLNVFGAMSAGRTIQLRVILLFFAATFVRRGMGLKAWPFRWTPSRRALLAVLVVAAGWYFLIFVWSLRAGGIKNVSIEAGRFHKDATESVALQQMPRGTPNNVRSLITFTALYTTTIADNFSSFYENVDLDPYYGLWELQPLVSGLTQMGIPVKPIDQILTEVPRGFEAVGLRHSQWRSMAQEFVLDFGKIGALLAVFINGLAIGFTYRKFKQGKPQFGILLTFMLMWTMYGAWTSPFGYFELQEFGYCFVFMVLLEFLKGRRSSQFVASRVVLPAQMNAPIRRSVSQ